MIGNDIVDLEFAKRNSRCLEQRFLAKVFSDEEQKGIEYSDNKYQTLWLLWSMKESAYKIHSNIQGLNFNPKQIHCRLTSEIEGIVLIENREYNTSSEISDQFIYTIAFSSEIEALKSETFEIGRHQINMQRATTYNAFLYAYSKANNHPITSLKILKNDQGIPKLFDENQPLDVSFSLTHHGNYGGFAFF